MPGSVVASFIRLLRRLELTAEQTQTADTRIQGLRKFFADNFSMAEAAFSMGSYRRQTLVRDERDIDLIAPLFYPVYKSYYSDSRKFLYFVRQKLNQGYSTTEVSSRQLAVILNFTVIRAEVVPAFKRSEGGYLIPDGNGGWQSTNPRYHTELIDGADAAHGGRLKPLVRLMKFWNIANGSHLTSFHTELMVERMWRGHAIPAYPAGVAETLRVMPSWATIQFPDPWPAGSRVDAYLSGQEKQLVVRMLNDDAKASKEAEENRSVGKDEKAIERWNSIFRRQFPASG